MKTAKYDMKHVLRQWKNMSQQRISVEAGCYFDTLVRRMNITANNVMFVLVIMQIIICPKLLSKN